MAIFSPSYLLADPTDPFSLMEWRTGRFFPPAHCGKVEFAPEKQGDSIIGKGM
jgi:hypothetical protein